MAVGPGVETGAAAMVATMAAATVAATAAAATAAARVVAATAAARVAEARGAVTGAAMLAAALAALAAMTAVTVAVVTLAASVVQASHSLGRGTTRPRSPGPCLAPPAPGMLSSQSASPREELALLPHSLSCRCELWPLGAGRHSNCSGRSTHSIQCRRRSNRPCPQCRASRRSGEGRIQGRRPASSRILASSAKKSPLDDASVDTLNCTQAVAAGFFFFD